VFCLLLLCLIAGAFTQSLTDAQKVDQAIALVSSVTCDTDTCRTRQKDVTTRLGTFKTYLPVSAPIPPPAPPVYATVTMLDALAARVAKLESGTPTPTPTPEPTPAPTPTPDPIVLPPITGSHGYFDALVSQPSFLKGFSLRDADQLKGIAEGGYRSSSGFYIGETVARVTYAPESDTHQQRQDAAKIRIPAFTRACPDSQPNGCVLAQPMTADDTVLTFSGSQSGFDGSIGRAVKVDDEIMVIVVPSNATALSPKNVKRGQFGTTATAHAAGTPFSVTTNSLDIRDGIRLPIRTDGTENATYLLTWDAFHTEPGWVGWTGQNQAYKQFQISSSGRNDRWFEFEPRFDACGPSATSPVKHPACIPGTHIGSAGARLYAPLMAPINNRYPGAPVKEPFLIEASKWIRYWLKVEAQNETTGHVPVTTLSAPLDASGTTAQIAFPASTFPAAAGNPFYDGQNAGAGTDFPGRSIQVGAELLTVSTCTAPVASVLTCTVARGAYGTTAQTHTAGAAVGLSFDYVTLIMADEDTDATVVYDRLPMYLGTRHADPKMRGSIEQFWLEFDTSGGDAYPLRFAQNWADWAFYVKNLAVLKNPGDVTPLLVKPIR
jgi:hypothetical protein